MDYLAILLNSGTFKMATESPGTFVASIIVGILLIVIFKVFSKINDKD